MRNTWRVFYKKWELLTIRGQMGTLAVFGEVRVANRFANFCFVFLLLFVFVLCLVYPMLLLCLGCPFLIAPSVFSNVYIQSCKQMNEKISGT